jgi:hypothetical protein
MFNTYTFDILDNVHSKFHKFFADFTQVVPMGTVCEECRMGLLGHRITASRMAEETPQLGSHC